MTELQEYLSLFYASSLVCLLGVAAWQDIATRTIADGISIALVVVGLMLRLCMGLEAVGASLLVAIGLFLVLLPLCSRGLLGGADLKLIAATSVGLSPQASLHLLVTTTAMGGVLAVFYLVAGKVLRRSKLGLAPKLRASARVRRVASIEFWRMRRGASLPYGIAIAVGAIFVVLQQQGV